MQRYAFTIGSTSLVCIAAASLLAADQTRLITNTGAPTSAPDNTPTYARTAGPGTRATLVIPGSGPAIAPAAIVSRELSLQPTYDRLVIVQIAGTNTIIDPYADLRRADMPSGGLDDHHMLFQVQRLWQSRFDQDAPRVIVGGPDAAPSAAEAQPDPSFVRLPAASSARTAATVACKPATPAPTK